MTTRAPQRAEEPAVELLLGYSPTPMWIYDRETLKFLAVNDAAVQHYGYTRDEFLAMDLLAIRPTETIGALIEQMQRRSRSEPYTTIEQGIWQHQAKDGTVFDVHVTSHQVIYNERDANLVIAQDIGEQLQAYRDLRGSEERYRNLFNTMAQGVVYQDETGAIISANPAAERILGLSLDQMQGRLSVDPLWRAVREDGSDFPGEIHPAMVALRTGQPVYDVVMGVYHPGDGSQHWININAVPQFRAGESKPYQVYATFEDITMRKEFERMLEQRVQERTAELQRASRVKDEFLANMSHELRTPLQGILGFTEMLADGIYAPVSDAQRHALAMITASGEHLLQLINDILDLAKIEAEIDTLTYETIDVDTFCRSCLDIVKDEARRRGVALSLAVELDLQVTADSRRLKQILVNLLDNAIKFAPRGGRVYLRASSETQDANIRFAVEDTGLGIAPEHLEHIFERFAQVDSSLARKHEGTGLGLALVKRLVDMHGGSIVVESVEGKGSCFTVTLPAQGTSRTEVVQLQAGKAGAPAEIGEPRLNKGANPNILLAEDNETTATIMSKYLQSKGYQVSIVANGSEVLKAVESVTPDLILMDIQMPVLDGLEAMQRLRMDARFAETPIIALTALAMVGDRERCLAAGATAYVSKPVNLRELGKILQQHLATVH